MSETFQTCKDKIGQNFNIAPGFTNQTALTLIKYSEPYLTFYNKTGSREIRYDLKEPDFKFYIIIHA